MGWLDHTCVLQGRHYNAIQLVYCTADLLVWFNSTNQDCWPLRCVLQGHYNNAIQLVNRAGLTWCFTTLLASDSVS
jgi:hypothetical protein